MRHGEGDLDQHLIPQAVDDLQRLEWDLSHLAAPSDAKDIGKILAMISGVVQVDVPEDMGLEAYVQLLRPLPLHVLRAAALEILGTHTYRTMPLPAEFLQSRAAREWKAVIDHFIPMLRRHRLALLKTPR